MTYRLRSLSLAVAAAALTAGAAFAQGASAAPQMFIVHREHALPSKLADYEATTKEFVALVQANRSTMPRFSFTALQGEDLSYNFIPPIATLADADAILASFDALAKAAGPQKFADGLRGGGGPLRHADAKHLTGRLGAPSRC